MIYVFAFGWAGSRPPAATRRGTTIGLNWPFIKSVIYHGMLPAIAIVITSMGFWALGMRGMMITNDGEDYMILAQAKGLRATPYLLGLRHAQLDAAPVHGPGPDAWA